MPRCLSWGSKLSLFLCGESKSTLFYVFGPNTTSFLCMDRNDMTLARGSKLAWFLCPCQKKLVFNVGIGWLSCLCVVEIES